MTISFAGTSSPRDHPARRFECGAPASMNEYGYHHPTLLDPRRPPAVASSPSSVALSEVDRSRRWVPQSVDFSRLTVPARRHVSALAARRAFGLAHATMVDHPTRSGSTQSHRPGHGSLRSGTGSAATWRQGCDDRRAGEHQNGTFFAPNRSSFLPTIRGEDRGQGTRQRRGR